jgi:hypothetical protein
MMGERTAAQEALIYSFVVERHVPTDHLLRSIDRFGDLSGTREHCRIAGTHAGPELFARHLAHVLWRRSADRLASRDRSAAPHR